MNDNYNSNKKRAGLIANKALELIILPTEQCNFRCTYCYEDFSIGRMKPETVSAIKKMLQRRFKDLKTLRIAWFGGEPLVAKDIMYDICQYASSLAAENPNLNYVSNAITNGYVLNINTATKLAEVGINTYQISLDGPQEVHDQSRIRADGKSTFREIWSNLIAIRNSSLAINITLRIHFTAETFQLLDPLIIDLRKEFFSDERFGFYFHGIGHMGGANDSSINILSGKQKIDAIATLENKLFGERANDSSQNERAPDDYVCYASKPNSLLIRANGNIGKCTVALSDERNNIGSIQPDGSLKLIPSRFSPWIRGIETLDEETLGCPLINLPTSKDIADSLREKKLVAQV